MGVRVRCCLLLLMCGDVFVFWLWLLLFDVLYCAWLVVCLLFFFLSCVVLLFVFLVLVVCCLAFGVCGTYIC